MTGKVIIGSALIALSLSACSHTNSQVPLATSYEYSTQQRMQAAHHWDVLAEDIATRLKKQLKSFNSPINVVPANSSPFQTAFQDLLITQLVDQGFDIREGDNADLKLTFNTQVVAHSDRGYVRPKNGTFTTLSMLATGVWAAINIADNASSIANALLGAGIIGTGVAMDATAGNISAISNKEVIINVSLMQHDRYLMRQSAIYYINEPDDYHYQKSSATKTMNVVAD